MAKVLVRSVGRSSNPTPTHTKLRILAFTHSLTHSARTKKSSCKALQCICTGYTIFVFGGRVELKDNFKKLFFDNYFKAVVRA